MNVSGVSSAVSSVNAMNFGSTASLKVMELAENVTEDAMSALLDTLDAMISGLGGSIDVAG